MASKTDGLMVLEWNCEPARISPHSILVYEPIPNPIQITLPPHPDTSMHDIHIPTYDYTPNTHLKNDGYVNVGKEVLANW
ncbi:hypothetical protein PV326_008748, partial [Microctonus aethiopoides]